MRRRDFLKAGGGSVVAASPLAVRAQQSAMPSVGFLNAGSAIPYTRQATGFREGLSETGYVEGRNVLIEYRWAEGHNDRLPTLAADLVQRHVAVIAATTLPAAPAAKAATGTIPIVFLIGGDPVELGFVKSMDRPGGNMTGVAVLNVDLIAKRLELLHELVPKADTVAVLVNPNSAYTGPETSRVHEAGLAAGLKVLLLPASNENEIGIAFANLVRQQVSALIVSADPFFTSHRDQVVALAARHAIPTIYQWRDFPEIGGLVSYGADRVDIYRQTGVYVGRILSGVQPSDLPVVQPTKFEVVINLKTAKALDISVPIPILGRADEVIE
jgi:putative tryptophan/tyrosine transport system substrate-binding protein